MLPLPSSISFINVAEECTVMDLSRYDLHIFESKKSPCDECPSFKRFGRKCWFFWENKKDCSQRSE